MSRSQDLLIANIQRLLALRDRNQTWLGKQVKASHVTMSRWMNKHSAIGPEALDRIAVALEVSVAELYREEGEGFVVTGRDVLRYLKDAVNDPDVFEDLAMVLSTLARKRPG